MEKNLEIFIFWGFPSEFSPFLEKVDFLHVHSKRIFYTQITRYQAEIRNTVSQNVSPKNTQGIFQFLKIKRFRPVL